MSLGSYQFPVSIIGNINYVLKMNAAGEVQWLNVPVSYAETEGGNPAVWTGNSFAYGLALYNDELAVATQVSDENWGTVSIDRPAGHFPDAGLLRLNKNTGEAIALHDIMSDPGPGSMDGLTAVAVDNDGNYITGGYFHNNLFSLTDDNLPTLTKVAGEADFTDFFEAKLAAVPCGTSMGTDDLVYNMIKAYPNPVKDMLTLSYSSGISSVTVYNLLGQALIRIEVDQTKASVDMSELPAGTYIVNVTTDGMTEIIKVIKQ